MKNLKWKYSQMWKDYRPIINNQLCEDIIIFRVNGHYELRMHKPKPNFIRDLPFQKLSTAKKVAQLIHNG